MLQMFLSNGKILAVHLKLTGRLLVRKKTDKKDDFQRIIFKLKTPSISSLKASGSIRTRLEERFLEGRKNEKGKTGDLELRFCDARKFGWIKLLDTRELRLENRKFGVEPLTKEFTLDKFKEILNSTGRAVKIVLMDQKKMAGVGNIYANDALFLAKIDPRRPAKKITEEEAKKLYEAIEKVLKAGIKYRGASDQNYLDALGQKGAYQKHFLVYKRDGEKCLKCHGEIKRLKVGGRGSFFCDRCQK